MVASDPEAAYREMLEKCRSGYDGCEEAYLRFLEVACRETATCPPRRARARQARPARLEWIERIIEYGVPDGRSRLILYVISRYLVNVKGLSIGDAEKVIDGFLNASCENHGKCTKIYRSWVRNVLKRVKDGGWRPWSLDRLAREDPELYKLLVSLGVAKQQ